MAITEPPTRGNESLVDSSTQPGREVDDRHRLLQFTTAAPSTVAFIFLLLVGLAVRLLMLPTVAGLQNSDHSIVYLMARHVADGDFQVFYWGQHYGGAPLQITAGALFLVTGSSFIGLQVVEIGYWLVASVLLRSIVANASGVLAGNTAGALLWMASPTMVTFSFHDPGFYGPAAVLGLCAVRIAQGGRQPGRLAVAGLGLVVGLALWATPLALALVLPSAVWLGSRVRSAASWLIGAGCTLVGASPWLWANARSGFASLEPQESGEDGPVIRFLRVFGDLAPTIMDQAPESARGRAMAGVFVLALVAGLAFGLRRRNDAFVLLCISALLVPAVVAVSGVVVVPAAARYAALILPAIAAVVGWAVSRHWALAAATAALVSAWTLATVWDWTSGFERISNPTFGPSVERVGTLIEQSGRKAVWADYWVAYLLTAATDERVMAAAIAPSVYRRQPRYERAASLEPDTTVVLFAGRDNDLILGARPGLPPHRRTVIGRYAVWEFTGRLDVLPFLTALPLP